MRNKSLTIVFSTAHIITKINIYKLKSSALHNTNILLHNHFTVELDAKTFKETRSARFYDGNAISQASFEKNSFGSGYIVSARNSEGKICIGILTSRDKFWTTSTLCDGTKTP